LNDYSPKWSPDGSKIAFVSERNSPNIKKGTRDICIARSDGSNIEIITDSSMLLINDCDWSPDGSKVIYSGLDSDKRHIISIIDIANNNLLIKRREQR